MTEPTLLLSIYNDMLMKNLFKCDSSVLFAKLNATTHCENIQLLFYHTWVLELAFQ